MQHKLSSEAKALLLSFVIYNILLPLLTTFTNAYIWRERGDLTSLLIFYIPAFCIIPVAFIIDGWLLKKIPIKWLFGLGIILLAMGNFILVFWKEIDNTALIITGLIWGLTIGLYWSNRNILTQQSTNDSNRNYFAGLETSLQIIISLIVPILIGYFIELTNKYGIISYEQSYKLLIGIALFGAIIGALFIVKSNFTDYTPRKIWLRSVSTRWNKLRFVSFLMGITSGISTVFPSYLVLTMIGKEGSLGFMDSISALFGAVFIYFIGKKITAEKRHMIFYLSLFIEMAGMFVFYFFWGNIGAAIYVLFTKIRASVSWIGINSLIMKFVDKESHSEDKYAYVFDREIFLNIGRLLSLIIFIPMLNTPLITGLTPFILLLTLLMLVFIEHFVNKTKGKMLQ